MIPCYIYTIQITMTTVAFIRLTLREIKIKTVPNLPLLRLEKKSQVKVAK